MSQASEWTGPSQGLSPECAHEWHYVTFQLKDGSERYLRVCVKCRGGQAKEVYKPV